MSFPYKLNPFSSGIPSTSWMSLPGISGTTVIDPKQSGAEKMAGAFPTVTARVRVTDIGADFSYGTARGGISFPLFVKSPFDSHKSFMVHHHLVFFCKGKKSQHTGFGVILPALNLELRQNRDQYKSWEDVYSKWRLVGACATTTTNYDAHALCVGVVNTGVVTLTNYWGCCNAGVLDKVYLVLKKVETEVDFQLIKHGDGYLGHAGAHSKRRKAIDEILETEAKSSSSSSSSTGRKKKYSHFIWEPVVTDDVSSLLTLPGATLAPPILVGTIIHTYPQITKRGYEGKWNWLGESSSQWEEGTSTATVIDVVLQGSAFQS